MVTWWQMARRPRWLGVLAFVIALAAIFVLLSQWQIGRAIAEATVIEVDSETAVPLESIVDPGRAVSGEAGGRRVTVVGTWSAGGVIVEDRPQVGQSGQWLVHNFVTTAGDCLPVAVGWATTVDAAEFVFIDDAPSTITGRIVPTEAASDGDYMDERLTVVSSADLVNRWQCDSMYAGFLAMEGAPAPLDTIATVRPAQDASLNWLNLFYAAEWIVFAGFALYFWYRVVLDAVERENDPDGDQPNPAPTPDN